MKIARIIIAVIMLFISTLSVNAEGYSMLVIPKSSISLGKRITLGNVDIEELLARKFIDKLEDTDIGYAPTLRVLKISINNNSAIKLNSEDYLSNIRAISRAYGVPRVLYIYSKKELVNTASQKEFWNKMDLPVLTQNEANIKVTTVVTLYDTKKDEIVYTDVFYKKMNLSDGAESTKLSALTTYYDGLISKVFNDIKESKETHAIMVSDKSQLSKETPKPTTYTEPEKDVKIRKIGFFEEMKMKYNEAKTDRELERIAKESDKKPASKKIEPDLAVKENTVKTEKPSFMDRLKDSLQPKDDYISEEQKRKEKQLELDRKNDTKLREEQEKRIAKEQENARKMAEKLLKEQQKKEKEQLKRIQEQSEKTAEAKKKPTEQLWTIPIKKIEYDDETIAEKTKEVEQMSSKSKPVRLHENNNPKDKKFVLKDSDKDNKTVTKKKQKVAVQKKDKPEKPVEVVNKKDEITPVKTAKIKEPKPIKVKEEKVKLERQKLSEVIKSKIKNYKERQALKNANRVLAKEKEEKSKDKYLNNIIVPVDDDFPSANRFIQTRIRNNAKFYTPKYDYSVNDM